MPKNSKRRKLKSNLAKRRKGKAILSAVTSNPSLGDRKVAFSFEKYNQSECEISKLQKKEVKQLTRKLKMASGQTVAEFNSASVHSRVGKSGNYTSLYIDIPEDESIVEIKYSDAGRIFGCIVGNTFGIVAICKKHR